MSATPAYDLLAAGNLRLHRLGHLGDIAHWDQETHMPPHGAAARGAFLTRHAAPAFCVASSP